VEIHIEATIRIEERRSKASDQPFGEWLWQERTSKKLTKVQLSRLSGVSDSHIGRIEKGERIPRYDIARKLQRALEERADIE